MDTKAFVKNLVELARQLESSDITSVQETILLEIQNEVLEALDSIAGRNISGERDFQEYNFHVSA